jgi:membrane-associated protease RseP (regulator of RpoE activity)
MGHRRALFDIGITGPLAGLVPTLICLVVGIHWSHKIIKITDFQFGDPLLFKWIEMWLGKTIPPGYDLVVHPLAFAGWVGLLITSLNLIPIGQLDGGHILYALLRKKAHLVATGLLYAAMIAVLFNLREYLGWWLMLLLLIYMGPRHPPTADDDEPLGLFRHVLGWLTLAFVVIGFTPQPFIMK